MKVCVQCGQLVAEEINTCPACGNKVEVGRTAIDDYQILQVLHEGYSSILCKARQDGVDTPVMIRIFTPHSGVDARLADRLKNELEELQSLPETYFVRHLTIRRSAEGLWYRISEWIETLNWGTLLSTGRLEDFRISLALFYQIASILDGLHRIGHIIPHLHLDDILVYEDDAGALRVKIDYKLSRFLDPQLDKPEPMLARLLALHPDILNQRPLDHRSDIWSLGKAFVEVLSADPGIEDLPAMVGTLAVPAEMRTLVRLMLSDNPDLRPQSMAEVAATLKQIQHKLIHPVPEDKQEELGGVTRTMIRRVNLRLGLLALSLTVAIAIGGGLWHNFYYLRKDNETALRDYANQYAGAVAFVVVDYWLRHGDQKIYRNRTEGTAFLADDQGFLLTNRHVACPWLEDKRLKMIINLFRQRPEELHFEYRIYLWFDGQRAFSRLPVLSASGDVEDIYVTESAFSSQGPRRVWIAGVASVPVNTRERIHSPLGDDFAVLKIDTVPPGLRPLPLAEDFSAAGIPKLTPLITLGFPLGSQTQAATVNVSVTSGHVRRTFENMFQVDVSLHSGNSGGPLIDARGRVVGLATIVAVRRGTEQVPIAMPLSDIGMALPITKAAVFLDEIKAGSIKWNGEIDVSLEKRLQRITDAALRQEWEKARDLADEEIRTLQTPPLLMAAALMHLCTGDYEVGRRLFDQVLSIDPASNTARLMILVTDWLRGGDLDSIHRQSLLALDWRSPDEFLGYLAGILAGEVNIQTAVSGGYTSAEKSWLYLIIGLIEEHRGKMDAARSLLEKAVLAADTRDWSLYLALSQLARIRRTCLLQLSDISKRQALQQQFEAFDRQLKKTMAAKKDLRAKLTSIRSALHGSDVDLETQRSLLKDLRSTDLENSNVLTAEAFYAAMSEDWEAALGFARQFLARPGRVNASKLSMGLLEPEILYVQGKTAQARESLADYRERITDPWYRELSACLLNPAFQENVAAKAGESPENLLTGHTALGLWAEGSRDITGAIKHYREALGSYADHRIEYGFAMARLKRLRQPAP
jgi:tetratricopeptide (TPR) repeat protein